MPSIQSSQSPVDFLLITTLKEQFDALVHMMPARPQRLASPASVDKESNQAIILGSNRR